MKNTKTLIILCLFLTAIGCSDAINWLGEDLEDLEHMEEIQDEKENTVNELRDLRLEAIKAVEDAEQKRRDVKGEIEIDYENERKPYIDTDKDSELEKRDKDGNKTYWSNEQDPEF